jgi:hypothetical protein
VQSSIEYVGIFWLDVVQIPYFYFSHIYCLLNVCNLLLQCFFDTPGLIIGHHGYPKSTDVRVRVESAWNTIYLYDMLIVLFDVHRHLTM